MASDTFVPAERDPRSEGYFVGERAVLVGYLRDMRLTLELKCEGLDAEALARRAVPPSTLSLLGLVRHMAEVERKWFRRVVAGESDAPPFYLTDDDPDADFAGAVADPAVVEAAWRNWRAEVEFAERAVERVPDLSVTVPYAGRRVELREVMTHLIQEYARHLGHADLLRERIDGRVGV